MRRRIRVLVLAGLVAALAGCDAAQREANEAVDTVQTEAGEAVDTVESELNEAG
jgi:hypothetical protein